MEAIMMNFTGKVIEIKDSQNYAYILESPTLFYSVGYKVLLGQEKNGFIKCTKVTHNGKDKLVYDTSKFKTLESLMYISRFDLTLNILINFLDAIIMVKSNGFMQCENILISPDHIFVDCENYNVNLIYLPINHESDNASYSIFEAELKANLFVVLNTYIEQNPYIKAICENMNNPEFTIEAVCAAFKDLKLNNYDKLNFQKGGLGGIFGKKKDRAPDSSNEDRIGSMKKLFSFPKKNK